MRNAGVRNVGARGRQERERGRRERGRRERERGRALHGACALSVGVLSELSDGGALREQMALRRRGNGLPQVRGARRAGGDGGR